MLSEEIKTTLKSIEISYLFAKKLNHAISDEKDVWKLFEPTKFIYSFFAFNMLYEYDWEKTLRTKFFLVKNIHASKKISNFLEFIYSQNKKSFSEYYQVFDNKLKIISHAKDIQNDRNIDKKDYTEFLSEEKSYFANYVDAVEKINSENFSIQDHYKLLIFCYQIRNNIFHGMKKATQMIESGQRERLIDYSHILIATMEMFYDMLQHNYSYHLANDYEFYENTQIR